MKICEIKAPDFSGPNNTETLQTSGDCHEIQKNL